MICIHPALDLHARDRPLPHFVRVTAYQQRRPDWPQKKNTHHECFVQPDTYDPRGLADADGRRISYVGFIR